MPENNNDGARSETSRTRSPNYPSIPLPEAISRAKQVYDKEHTHKASSEVVAKAMGYTGLNGTSRSTISALKKYGLLQADGDGLKVTSDAVDIFELPTNDPISMEARKRAAFKPSLFAEFKETYGNKLPSDANLRHVLIKRGFNPRMASEVIQIYKDTLESVADVEDTKPEPPPSVPLEQQELGFEASKNLTPQYGNGRQNGHAFLQPQFPQNPTSPSNQHIPSRYDVPSTSLVTGDGGFVEALQCRVSGNSKARVLFDGVVTQEAIKKLIAYLELSLDDYPANADLGLKKEKPVESEFRTEFSKGQTPSTFSQTGVAIWHAADADHEVNIVGYAGEKGGKHYYYTENNTGLPVDEVEFLDED
ncbi:hypothetical protein IAD21_03479 [Abditibacteriota bacterium]|nr:hypothetical protein IAD21_03479 [Abditibacteriota bacterium]